MTIPSASSAETGPRHARVILPAAHRKAGLRVDVTFAMPGAAPARIVLFSHGAGRTGADYAPLLNGWAGSNLIILAPLHEAAHEPGWEAAAAPLWLARVRDLQTLAATLDQVERAVPALRGRLAGAPLLLAGHSFGGHTVALLSGARPLIALAELAAQTMAPLSLPNASNAILLAPPGDGGPGQLTAGWAEKAPYLALDWSGFTGRALIVAGTQDVSPMSPRDWRWHQDAYTLSPRAGKHLLVADGGGHYLGGIATAHGKEPPWILRPLIEFTAAYANGRHPPAPDGFTLSPPPDADETSGGA